MSDIAAAIAPEIVPPAPTRKPRVKRNNADPTIRKKRGPPRPYRKIPENVLTKRIERLTKRMERVKRQHESTRVLLTKYAHEKFYREKEILAQDEDDKVQPPTIEQLP